MKFLTAFLIAFMLTLFTAPLTLCADPSPVPSAVASIMPSADFPMPQADIAPLLLQLATNYKTLGVMGILVILTLLSVQVIKQFVPEDFKWKRLIVLAVSIIYSILAGVMVPGSNVASVIVSVFITGGGAIALFECLKGLGVFKSVKIA